MDYKKEIERREKRIESYKKEIRELCDEITALRQLLDCAAANIILILKKEEHPFRLSKEEVRDALGKYHLQAREEDGCYVLEILSA